MPYTKERPDTLYSHDAHYGWLIPPPTHYSTAPVNPGPSSLSLAESSLVSGNCDRYGRSVSTRAVSSNRSTTPYSRPRVVSGSGSNGSTGNASPPQPPSAPQTPTGLHPTSSMGSTSISGGYASSYSQSGFMPVEPTPSATVFSYPGSWQTSNNYWSSTTVPGPLPVNTARVMSKCFYFKRQNNAATKFMFYFAASHNSPSPTNNGSPTYTSPSPGYTIHHLTPHSHNHQYNTMPQATATHTPDMYQSVSSVSPNQSYAAPTHQVYHPTPTSPSSHQLYTNVLNGPSALSYPGTSWHNGSAGAEYGLYQNPAAYAYQTEYIPLVSEIG